MFSLVDDDDVKDLPSTTEIASGFHNDNAYYIERNSGQLVDQICQNVPQRSKAEVILSALNCLDIFDFQWKAPSCSALSSGRNHNGNDRTT